MPIRSNSGREEKKWPGLDTSEGKWIPRRKADENLVTISRISEKINPLWGMKIYEITHLANKAKDRFCFLRGIYTMEHKVQVLKIFTGM